MKARLDAGWLTVGPYTGPDLAPCFIAVGVARPGEWQPAFKSWRGGERVLQVRPPDMPRGYRVWVRVAGTVSPAGGI